MLFSDLGLADQLLRAISEQGYQTPTPIQSKAIPVILDGRDILAGAQTGTGKTAAFGLPLLQILLQQPILTKPRPIRVLILAPTRELAIQVHENIKAYSKYSPFFAEAIFGGVNMVPQIQKLSRGTDIVVATPGRLLDLIHQGHVNLSQVQHFVLDEADRMLDMGFIKDIKKIISLLPHKRQNLLFSATYSAEISLLAEQFLNNPIEIAVAKRNSAAETVSQLVYGINREHKRELLSYLIGNGNWRQVLVFVRTKHGADRLCKQLIRDGIRCAALHGDKSQGARIRALDDFKNGGITALIATDIAARGLDIDLLPHVVNFDLPQVAEDYVHRIGRTGRAGSEGRAISLVDPEEAYLLVAIEKLLNRKIPRVADTGYAKVSLDDVNSVNKAKTSTAKNKPNSNRPAKPLAENSSQPAKKHRSGDDRSNRHYGKPAKKTPGDR